MADGIPLRVVKGSRSKEESEKKSEDGEGMQGLQAKSPSQTANGALVQDRECEKTETRSCQDQGLRHFPPHLEVLSHHQAGGVSHRAAAKWEEQPVGEENLVQLVTEGSEEESQVHDETADHCGQPNTALSAEVGDDGADAKAGAPGGGGDQGGDQGGGGGEVGGHLQAEHTPSKEQASGEGLGKGAATHDHPAPSTLRVVVVADSRKLDVSPSKSRYVLVQGPHVPLPQQFEPLHLLKLQQLLLHLLLLHLLILVPPLLHTALARLADRGDQGVHRVRPATSATVRTTLTLWVSHHFTVSPSLRCLRCANSKKTLMDEILILGIGSLASFCIYSRFLLFPLQHLVPPSLWISKIQHHFNLSPFAFVCQITCAVSHLDNLLLSPEVKVSSLFYTHTSRQSILHVRQHVSVSRSICLKLKMKIILVKPFRFLSSPQI